MILLVLSCFMKRKWLGLFSVLLLVIGTVFGVNYLVQLKKLIDETPAMEYKRVTFIPPKDIVIFDKVQEIFVPFSPSFTKEDTLPLSVVVPVHNVEDYLVECLDSIVNKSDKPYEIILVENNSTDGSLEIAKRYAKEHANVMLIKQDGGGLGGARNTGMMAAHGEYITFIDSDDYFVDNAINMAMANVATQKPDMVIFSFYYFDNLTKKVRKKAKLKFADQETVRTHDHGILDISYGSYAWARLYKRKTLRDTGVLFKEKLYHEDLLFAYMLCSYDIDVKFVDNPILYYRTHRTGSIMATGLHTDHMMTVYEELKDFLKEKAMYEGHENSVLDAEIRDLNHKAKLMYNKDAIALYKYMHNYYAERQFKERGISPTHSDTTRTFNRIMKERYMSLILRNNLKTITKKHRK